MMDGLVKTGLMEQSSFLSPDSGDAEDGEGPEFVSPGILSDAAASAGSGSDSQIECLRFGSESGMMKTVRLEVEPQPHRLEVAARFLDGTRRPKRGTRTSRNHARCEAAMASVLCVCVATMLLQAPAASAYLIKSHLYWERVGAFPHYLTQPAGGGQSFTWPRSSLCYNGPDCSQSIDQLCNPDCGNPDIGIAPPGGSVQDTSYPKPFLVRFVSLLFRISALSSLLETST